MGPRLSPRGSRFLNSSSNSSSSSSSSPNSSSSNFSSPSSSNSSSPSSQEELPSQISELFRDKKLSWRRLSPSKRLSTSPGADLKHKLRFLNILFLLFS